MKIESIKIKNFRCFEDLELHFNQCHALIGVNGSGKTSVLEAINFASSGGLAYLNEQDFNDKDKGDLMIELVFNEAFLMKLQDGYITQDIPCRGMKLEAHRRKQASGGKAFSEPIVVEKYAVPCCYTSTTQVAGIEKLSGNIPQSISKTEKGYESPRKSGKTFQFTNQRLNLQNETVNYPDIFYFDRDRESEAKVGFNSLLTKVVKDLNWRYRDKWDQSVVKTKWEEFYGAVISTVEDPKNSRLIKPIQTKIKKITGVELSDLELSLLDIEQPFSKAFFARRNDTNQIEQKRLGSGISILLAYFLLEIASKLSKEEIIFLIDEPELHLHPQLQQALFKEFRDSESQVIYTTQSDCFVNIADWKNVARFSVKGEVTPKDAMLNDKLDSLTTSQHLDEIKKFHQQESIFFREDNQLFFANKCLLVEGPAEKYGLPIIANLMSKGLSGLTIISCNGKSKIPYYQLLCKAFGIPFFTLFDLDKKKSDEGDNKRPSSWAEKTACSTFATSFEELFGIPKDADHKTSQILIKIDALKKDNISDEIKKVINKISDWAKNG
jgi:predicted ATP-dependent endonuclease of OLD family